MSFADLAVPDHENVTPCGELIPANRPRPGISCGGTQITAPSLAASRAVASTSVTVKYTDQCIFFNTVLPATLDEKGYIIRGNPKVLPMLLDYCVTDVPGCSRGKGERRWLVGAATEEQRR